VFAGLNDHNCHCQYTLGVKDTHVRASPALHFSERRSLLAEFDKQIPVERRTKPTPSFGWYSFFGRRKQDHYSAPLFFSLVSITGLNVLDSLFTMMILDRKGWEANPIVRAVMETHGDNFWIWKFALVSFCLILLCLHSRYKVVKRMTVFLTSVYLVIVVYQIYLLHLP
jgi:hypothetical protein